MARDDAPRRFPMVTVGLAVYNGERYLQEAIDSILAQSFSDFELVICDNCSTDSTPDICGRYLAQDPRVRYFRNPRNIGGVRNENRTLFLARGSYFKLAAHDDRIAPRFLEECVAVLESKAYVEVCTTAVVVMDTEGNLLETRAPLAGTEDQPHKRIRAIDDPTYACEAIYGLIRTTALREVRPQTNHLHSDRVVLCELALRRPFYLLQEPLFFKRNQDPVAYAKRDWNARMAWYQPELALTGQIRLPHWQQVGDYATMLSRSRIGAIARLLCLVELGHCFWRMRRGLVVDMLTGLRMAVSGRKARRERYSDEERWR